MVLSSGNGRKRSEQTFVVTDEGTGELLTTLKMSLPDFGNHEEVLTRELHGLMQAPEVDGTFTNLKTFGIGALGIREMNMGNATCHGGDMVNELFTEMGTGQSRM
jgi:hypothetical protein